MSTEPTDFHYNPPSAEQQAQVATPEEQQVAKDPYKWQGDESDAQTPGGPPPTGEDSKDEDSAAPAAPEPVEDVIEEDGEEEDEADDEEDDPDYKPEETEEDEDEEEGEEEDA